MIHLLSSLIWCHDNKDNFPEDITAAQEFLNSNTIASATYYAQTPDDFEAIEKCVEAAERIINNKE